MDMKKIATPALLLDMDKLDQNINDIADIAERYGVKYRPHIKTHKSIDIAKRQIKAGAIGLTVAKVGEAEIMAEAGIEDILIAFPISGEEQLERIKKLKEKAAITLMIDSTEQAEKVNSFFTKKQPLQVWIKVNSGLNRCGVEPNGEVLALAEFITQLPGLQLEGLFTHAGHSYGASSIEEVKKIAQQEAAAVRESAELCEKHGIPIRHRSVGSTPTFKYYENMDGITEIRPGNAVFYDMVQAGLGVVDKQQCALTVLSTVVSIKKGRIVIDAGSKSLALDKGAHGNDSIQGHGHIIEHKELTIDKLSEEHGVILLDKSEQANTAKIGERIHIIPNHACPVVNLFDQYIVHQDNRIIDTWNVSARGKNR